uniref:Uncharacterized protein n=1 Tax=Physcomitrium patens TaxID=3218 RepID=A0A2K1JUJ1_PHYPA|nr:hypothetical protein PHYPA_014973 [Physcomitrium patens]
MSPGGLDRLRASRRFHMPRDFLPKPDAIICSFPNEIYWRYWNDCRARAVAIDSGLTEALTASRTTTGEIEDRSYFREWWFDENCTKGWMADTLGMMGVKDGQQHQHLDAF